MRAVIQRVERASVTIAGDVVGKIGAGYLILLGVGHADTRAEADKLWGKIFALRINDDEEGKTNLSLPDVGGEVLVVSQFTLFANCRKGRRPSFVEARRRRRPPSSMSTSSTSSVPTWDVSRRAVLVPICRSSW